MTRKRILLLDPLGGLAGDMFVACVLDAFPELAAPLYAALESARVTDSVRVEHVTHNDGVFEGTRFVTRPAATQQGVNAIGKQCSHGMEHAHHHYRDLRKRLSNLALPAAVVERALDIMARLARAEGAVHGVAADDAVLHEVGAWDSLADIVSAAWLVDALGPSQWHCRPLPLGGGRVRSAHGLLPVPAPATAELLSGMPLHDDGISGERLTPTGAAILAHLAPSFARLPKMRLVRTGNGFGTRTLEGVSNVLRLGVASAEATSDLITDSLVELRFEIDDQSAEDLAGALDYLRGLPGVLECTQTPVVGKKGRLVTRVELLAEAGERDALVRACVQETTTLGVRTSDVRRTRVEREIEAREIDGDTVRVKRSTLPGGGVRAKAEHDDLRETRGREARQQRRHRAEQE